MSTVTVAIVAAAALCLAFPDTRLIGIAGAVLLSLLHPRAVLAASVAAIVVAIAFHHLTRRSFNVLAESRA